MANFLDDFSKAFEPSFRQGLAISPQFERLRIEREKLQTEEAQQAAALSAQGMIASVESAGQQWLADRMGERSQEFMAVNEAERVSRMAKAGATEKQIMDKLASFLPETDEATLSFMATVAKKNTDEFDNAVKHMFTRVAGGNPPDVTNLDNIVDFFSEVRGQKPPEVDMPRIKMEDQLRLNQFKQKQVALALDSLSDNPDVFGIHIGAMREYMGELSKEGLDLVKELEGRSSPDRRGTLQKTVDDINNLVKQGTISAEAGQAAIKRSVESVGDKEGENKEFETPKSNSISRWVASLFGGEVDVNGNMIFMEGEKGGTALKVAAMAENIISNNPKLGIAQAVQISIDRLTASGEIGKEELNRDVIPNLNDKADEETRDVDFESGDPVPPNFKIGRNPNTKERRAFDPKQNEWRPVIFKNGQMVFE